MVLPLRNARFGDARVASPTPTKMVGMVKDLKDLFVAAVIGLVAVAVAVGIIIVAVKLAG